MPAVSTLLAIVLGPLSFLISPRGTPTFPEKIQEIKRIAWRPLGMLPLAAEYVPPQRQLPETYLPVRDWTIQPPDIDARAGLVITKSSAKTLYERNFRERRPLASLTKLATALAVIDELPLEEPVSISKRAVATEGDFGNLVVDEKVAVRDLLAAMLIASSNDAAVALEEYLVSSRHKSLTQLMNTKVQTLGLRNSRFSSVNGLADRENFSTAEDLGKLFSAALDHPLLFQFLSTPETDIRSSDGRFRHHLVNSNKLLGHLEGVIAGKTGLTTEAGGSLVVLAENPQAPNDPLIAVVLGSTDEETRFQAMEALLSWVRQAYRW